MSEQNDRGRWRLMYVAVLGFLLLQIALYAWFTEAWK